MIPGLNRGCMFAKRDEKEKSKALGMIAAAVAELVEDGTLQADKLCYSPPDFDANRRLKVHAGHWQITFSGTVTQELHEKLIAGEPTEPEEEFSGSLF